MMDSVHHAFRWLWSQKWYGVAISTLIYINPIALTPQLWKVFTAPSVEGVSVTMWFVFLIVQLGFFLEGINKKSAPIALSMFISMIGSSTIIIVLLIRS